MRMVKLLITVGGFFFISQGITVFLFRKMFEFAVENKLPVEELIRYQPLIMKLILGSMIMFGILFFILVVVLIFRTWRPHPLTVSE